MLRNGGERLEDNMTIFGADPERTRSMVRFEMEPRKVQVVEDMGYESILLPPVNTQTGPILIVCTVPRTPCIC